MHTSTMSIPSTITTCAVATFTASACIYLKTSCAVVTFTHIYMYMKLKLQFRTTRSTYVIFPNTSKALLKFSDSIS